MISRATLLLIFSQFIYMICGFLMNIGLARLLGPEDYGLFGVILSVLVILELFVITGIPEAIQKFGGQDPPAMASLVKKTLPVQIVYVFLLYLGLFLAAPYTAKVFGDERLVSLFRLAGLDIIFFGLYKYYLGIQNGLHRFKEYTIMGIVYSISRLFLILVLVWQGFSIAGAVSGNFLGSAVGLLVGLLVTRFPGKKKMDTIYDLKNFILLNVLYFVGLNMLFSIDIWFVKYFVTDVEVGFYVAASSLAKFSYFIAIALHAVLLPSLSYSIHQNEHERAADIVKDSVRYLIVFLTLFSYFGIGFSGLIIHSFYGDQYRGAIFVFQILLPALSFITLTSILNTVLISYARMASSFQVVILALVLDIILNVILVPRFGIIGAAFATTIAGFLGVYYSHHRIYREIKQSAISLQSILLGFGSLGFVFLLLQFQVPVFPKVMIMCFGMTLLLIVTGSIRVVDVFRFKEAVLGSAKTNEKVDGISEKNL